MRWFLALALVSQAPLTAGTAADIARAIRENGFDRDECYRVRDLRLVKEDLRIFLADGHLIFSKPVAGRRIAAAFVADVEGGDGEVILLPPDRAERRSLATYIDSPNLDEHIRSALFLFTGDDYDRLMSQMPNNPANQKAPEMAALLDEQWSPALRNIGVGFAPRLTLDLLDTGGLKNGLLTGLFSSPKLGNFDVTFDPMGDEQMVAGQVTARNGIAFFDIWTSFAARSFRMDPTLHRPEVVLRDYRIEATVNPDLSMNVVTRVKVRPTMDGAAEVFEISPQMTVTEAFVDSRPAEVLQRDSVRVAMIHGGNNQFLVVPSEKLRAGQEYEFEFHHSGKVIYDAGDRVFYVSSRGTWYPLHGTQFSSYDLLFRFPKDLDLVAPGDVVEDHTEGDVRTTRRRTPSAIRIAAFNLGNYEHARLERGKFVVDVCANKALERALQPRPERVTTALPPGIRNRRASDPLNEVQVTPPAPDPMARLRSLALEVASALEFMASKFGPPTLPHLTVSPIPGTFGQGFPGLVYLSTLSYLKNVPGPRMEGGESQQLFFQEVLQAHETAHQWWGNRVSATSYRDYWLMEALANYSALAYMEKSKGPRDVEAMLDSYRSELLAKGENGQTVDSTGPIVLGMRLENSQEPRAWRTITYGKGSWIMQMLRQRMGDERFYSMLAEVARRYDGKALSTEDFRALAASFLPPKSQDPKLENFFEQWVYGTGIPTLKLTYAVKGAAPNLRLVGTVTQSDVGDDFTAQAPVEIKVAGGRTITQWVTTGSTPATFTVALKQAPVRVTLDPHHGVLRR